MIILIELLPFDLLTEHKYIHYLIPSVYCVKIYSLRYFHFHVFNGVIDIHTRICLAYAVGCVLR